MKQTQSDYWIKTAIFCSSESFEIVQSILFELGAKGTEELDGLVVGYFSGDQAADLLNSELERRLESLRPGLDVREVHLEKVPDQNWGESWNRHYRPIRINDRLVVKPPWLEWDGPEPVVIDIMPKMAFGTGTHETTRLCLDMMGSFIVPECTVLDVGTGSGILSIAAIRLGAAFAIGVDVDADAIENAVENAESNRVSDSVRFITGSLDRVGPSAFSLILANIQSGILTPLIPKIRKRMDDQTTVIFSGILLTEGADFQKTVESNGLVVIQTREKGEWMALECRRMVAP